MLSCRGSHTHVCPGCCVLTEIVGKDNCSSKSCDKRTPSRRLMTMCWRFVKAKSQTSEVIRLSICISVYLLIKPGKSLSFTSTPNSLCAATVFYGRTDEHFFFSLPLTAPLPVCLKVLDFSSVEKEQARTGKMNDINGQPILPGTCDWDKWALLH